MPAPSPTRRGTRLPLVAAVLLASCAERPAERDNPPADADQLARGRFIVSIGGCNDCHTPKVFTAAGPVPDSSRYLSGHPADAKVPPVPQGVLGPDGWGALTNPHLTAWAGPWGISFTANLTPDPTGLGNWTVDQFIQTMRTGKHLGTGRPILPPMPWQELAALPEEDLRAVFAYLRSIKPVANAVPAPVPPPAAQ